jgi:hypothetical protein
MKAKQMSTIDAANSMNEKLDVLKNIAGISMELSTISRRTQEQADALAEIEGTSATFASPQETAVHKLSEKAMKMAADIGGQIEALAEAWGFGVDEVFIAAAA